MNYVIIGMNSTVAVLSDDFRHEIGSIHPYFMNTFDDPSNPQIIEQYKVTRFGKTRRDDRVQICSTMTTAYAWIEGDTTL